MKKFLIGIIVGIGCLIPLFASAQVPFGGLATFMLPCDTGFLVYIRTAFGVEPLMWLTGELPYLMHIPPHPGQELLGEAGAVAAPCILTVPCPVGVCPIYLGSGLPIIYHGENAL